jgi:site-specific DNA-cytosine methylase
VRNPYNGKTSTTETGTLGTTLGTTTGKTAQHLHKDSTIRRLTPTECERLQGFPD